MLHGCFAAAKELAAALLSKEMKIAVDNIVESMMVGLNSKEFDIESLGGWNLPPTGTQQVYRREGSTGRYRLRIGDRRSENQSL